MDEPTLLEGCKKTVQWRLKGHERQWAKVDNEPDWLKKDKVMASMVFIGSALAYISALERYTKVLEARIQDLESEAKPASE